MQQFLNQNPHVFAISFSYSRYFGYFLNDANRDVNCGYNNVYNLIADIDEWWWSRKAIYWKYFSRYVNNDTIEKELKELSFSDPIAFNLCILAYIQ